MESGLLEMSFFPCYKLLQDFLEIFLMSFDPKMDGLTIPLHVNLGEKFNFAHGKDLLRVI